VTTNLKQTRFEFGFACDTGRKRKNEPNQDTVAVVLPKPNEPWHPPFLLVADGLGKYHGGELASQTVVNTFVREFKQSQHPTEYPFLLERCVQIAHQKIRELGNRDTNLSLMGSTVVAVILETDHLVVLNVGDSRAYLLDEKSICQVSRDHSWTAIQVQAGFMTESEARVQPNRNRLTMAITAKRTKVEFHLAEEKIKFDTVILLCSDGLWSVVPKSLIHAAAMELPPQIAANKLIKLANASKGPDNISVVIARHVGYEKKDKEAGKADTRP